MSHKIAVAADVHLLPETEERIQSLANSPVMFPHEDIQPTEQKLINRIADADVVLVSPGTTITKTCLVACPNIKYIGICGTAKENIDVAATLERNITITNVAHYGDESAAEFIFMQLALLARGMNGLQWKKSPVELVDKAIGIIGLGALGQAIAHLALAYKMQVQYCSRTQKASWDKRGLRFVSKKALLGSSDIIVISTPSNLLTIDATDFTFIKPNSILVQGSQGNCFDKAAFKQWVNKDNFGIFDYSAGSKNYEELKDLPHVIFPKVFAGYTYEARQRLGQKVYDNLKNYIESVP